MNQLLPIQPQSLPPGACYTSEQERLNGFAAAMNAVLAGGLAFYNYGNSAPAPELRGFPWLNTSDGLWYVYLGKWRTPRPVCEQDLRYRILWTGAEADVPTKDGGTAGTATTDTGPFWEIDTEWVGRVPIGPGEIPTSNPLKTLAVGDNFGEGAHTQLIAEMPAHSHTPDASKADGFLCHAIAGAPATFNIGGGGDTISTGATATTGTGDAMPIIQPVRAIWFLKPTIRVFFTIPG